VPITGFINTKGEKCYTVLILQKFRNPLSPARVENGASAPSPAPPLLEQGLAAQALVID